MTLTEARKTLRGKLKFGHPEKIKAVRFLEEFELIGEQIAGCKNSEEHYAIECNDEYAIDCLKYCGCIAEKTHGDVIVAVLRSIKSVRKTTGR